VPGCKILLLCSEDCKGSLLTLVGHHTYVVPDIFFVLSLTRNRETFPHLYRRCASRPPCFLAPSAIPVDHSTHSPWAPRRYLYPHHSSRHSLHLSDHRCADGGDEGPEVTLTGDIDPATWILCYRRDAGLCRLQPPPTSSDFTWLLRLSRPIAAVVNDGASVCGFEYSTSSGSRDIQGDGMALTMDSNQ
jgi:hypothetical protein